MKLNVRKVVGYSIMIAITVAFILVISKPPAEPKAEAQSATKETKKEELNQFDAADLTIANQRFEMKFEGKYGSVHVRDKQTGQTWDSVPEVPKTTPPNNLRYIRSPVFVRYTEGKGDTQTYPFKEQAKLKAEVIDGGKGIRATVGMTNLGITFAVEYRLNDEGFDVTVPFNSIIDGVDKKLVSIELMPFFEAAGEKDQGAMFLPDGSGAIVRFKENHPQYFDPYSGFVYGGDYAFRKNVYEKVASNPRELLSYGPREMAALPVYGLYKNGKAFLAIMEDGEEDAKVNGYPSGIRNIKLYHASAEFLYRNDDVIFIGSSGEIPFTQNVLISGDRKIRYVLLQGKQADYVGMAVAYRDYLVKEQGMKVVPTGDTSYQLRLLGGVVRKEIIGSTFIAMTTFNQAKSMVDGLIAKGVKTIELTYDGWSNGGEFGSQPAHLPADKHLGGTNDLRELIAYAKSKSIDLYLKTNYVKPYSKSDALSKSNDAIRGLNKEVQKVYKPQVTTRQASQELYYILKADRVFERFISKEAPKLANLGAKGIQLGYMGNMLYSDPGAKHPTARKETLETWVKAMDLARSSAGKAAVDYGFAYSLGHVDRIDNIPLDSSHYLYEDDSIPFYQIAVHGFIPYTAEPSNLRDDPRTEFLRALEYGAIPSFELTHEDPVKLKRTMIDDLFSSSFADWLDPSVDEYKKSAAVLDQVNKEVITGHEMLQPQVYRTTYSNGLQVTVNYGDEQASVDGVTIEPYAYAVKGGTT
jgi:hypothetical protein